MIRSRYVQVSVSLGGDALRPRYSVTLEPEETPSSTTTTRFLQTDSKSSFFVVHTKSCSVLDQEAVVLELMRETLEYSRDFAKFATALMELAENVDKSPS